MLPRIIPLLSLLLIIPLFGIPCLAEDATAAPVATTTSPAAPPPEQPSITHDPYRLRADKLSVDAKTRDIIADGNAKIDTPQGLFTASLIRYSFTTQSGYLDDAKGYFNPLRFSAKTMSLDAGNTRHIQHAVLTTCTHEHPHYALKARDFVLAPDNTYQARRVAMVLGGHTLVTIPSIRGNLGTEDATMNYPALTAGESSIDGAYVASTFQYPLSNHADVALSGRFGTKGLFRGEVAVNQQFSLGQNCACGKFSLLATLREDAPNQGISFAPNDDHKLRNLTISRTPALQVTFDAIHLPGRLADYQLRLGASAGHYREDPTGVTAQRAQIWGALRTPTLRLGPVQFSAEYGRQRAFYSGSNHWLSLTQLAMESAPEARRFFSFALLHRQETGSTPFLFDRVLIRNELASEMQVPLARQSPWRLGVGNRFDLDSFNSRDMTLSAFYAEDCLTYGLTYNAASQSFMVGMTLNAFGSTRKSAGRKIAFVQ